jgi:uncharacterized protein (DUF1697 family)
MKVLVSLLRGINLGGHHKIKMSELCALYGSLGHCDARSHINSGNVVFRTSEHDLAAVVKKLESAIEKKCGFHADVVVRSTAEMRDVIRRNPFAKRKEVEPGKLLVTFLPQKLTKDISEQIRNLKPDPAEMYLDGREIYTYFPDGAGRSKLFSGLSGRLLKNQGTARNWNTVLKLLEIAEELEAL